MRFLMTVPSFSLPYCAFFSSPSRSDPQIPVQNVKDLARPQRQSPSRSRRDSASGDHHQRRRSHSSSRHRSHRHDSRSDRRACWGCGTRVPEGKSLCDRCYARAVREKETETQHLESLVKRVVQQSLKELDSPHTLSQSTVLSGPPADEAREDPGTSQPYAASLDSSDDDLREEEEIGGFDFNMVSPLIKAIKEALKWEDPATPPAKQKKFFKHLGKERSNFPLLSELKDIIDEEWSKTDRKSSMVNKTSRLYPFKSEEVKYLENAPLVDAALMRLAKHVTLPLEDTVSFKDGLERRIDQDLKRIYGLAGTACKPAFALAAMSKAMEAWAENVDSFLKGISEELAGSSAAAELKLAAVFLGEASIDLIRLLARVMLSSVTAKRALWLRPWLADPISKQAWCKIPFEGSSLFGNKLDDAISRATGGKSGFLPQDRRLLGRKKPQFRRRSPERSREARSYKPGRDFRKNWSRGQASFRKSAKGQTSSGREQAKSF